MSESKDDPIVMWRDGRAIPGDSDPKPGDRIRLVDPLREFVWNGEGWQPVCEPEVAR